MEPIDVNKLPHAKHHITPTPQNKISCSCSGCLFVIVMSILICILVQECQRSATRLKIEQQLQEQLQKRTIITREK